MYFTYLDIRVVPAKDKVFDERNFTYVLPLVTPEKKYRAFDLGSVSGIFNFAVHVHFGRKVTDTCYFLGRC